jgi:predicted lipoprotein with Yx(FWY)xxD motif
MQRIKTMLLSGLALAVSAALAPAAATSAMSAAEQAGTIRLAAGVDGQNYLTDANGMTLYYYTKDARGESVCYGNCEKAWPVFFAPTVSVSPPLRSSDFGTITRTDGSKQTTFRGWPLYYWQRDAKPGDMTGEGVGKVWYVLKVPAYSVMVATSEALGNYLVDGEGRTLYWYTKDASGISACSGNCLKNWPAFTVSDLSVPSALNPADFATILRDDGTKQVTYRGYPLYYWIKDQKRGDTTGQNVGGVWFVIDPSKFPVVAQY